MPITELEVPYFQQSQLLQEVSDLQLAVQMRDDHLAECQRQSDTDQEQIDELERQLLMQACHSSVKSFVAYEMSAHTACLRFSGIVAR